MKNTSFLIKFFAFSLLVLGFPALASAQYGNNNDDDYYRRDNRNNRNDNYDNRGLSEAIRRVENRSNRLTRAIDRALDNSRLDGSQREDRVNEVASNFENAADRLKNAYNDGRNRRDSSDEAQQLISSAAQIDRFISRNQLDNRVASEWDQIRTDLQVIASAYNLRLGARGVFRRNNDDDYNNRRNNRRNNDNDNNNGNRRNRRGGVFPF